MKINYFYGSVAIRPRDGYTENLEFNVTESKGLSFRYPYGEATPEESEAISQFVKTVTNAYNKLTTQIDGVNKDLHLEQYAPKVSVAETSSESAAPQSCALGGGEGLTVPEIVQYAMETEIQDAPFEEVETAMDKAKTPEEMLEVMIASGERKTVRDLPM